MENIEENQETNIEKQEEFVVEQQHVVEQQENAEVSVPESEPVQSEEKQEEEVIEPSEVIAETESEIQQQANELVEQKSEPHIPIQEELVQQLSQPIETEKEAEVSIKEELNESDHLESVQTTSNAVADVIAAVEQSSQQQKTPKTPTSGKKKQKTNSQAKPSSSTSVSNNITNTINDIASGVLTNTSPSSGQKRRKKDPYAPKAPLNGYLVYFNEERSEMRKKNPNIGFGELTKIIAAKWKELSADDKQKYINEAEIDKERYVKEMADYKKSDAYKQYLKENSHNKIARSEEAASVNDHMTRVVQNGPSIGQVSRTEEANLSWLQSESNIAGFDIPIFTEEFIEHSKQREQEIRQLRKEINEIEQQNSVLNKHVENLKLTGQKLDLDLEQYKNLNNQLQKNIDIFRQTVLHCFNNTPLPNTQDYVPTTSNIDDYIMRLFQLMQLNNQCEQTQNINDSNYLMNRNFANHVKSVFSKINFSSLFENL